MGKKGFRGGIPGGIEGLMKQAQKMQGEVQNAKSAVEKKLFEAQTGGGAVKVAMTGSYDIKELSIAKDAIDPDDQEMLQDMIKAAFSEVMEKIKTANDEAMKKATGGLSIPGMM